MLFKSILAQLDFSNRVSRAFLKRISNKRKQIEKLEINGRARS